MDFKNVNSKLKRILRPLKEGSGSIDKWIRNVADIGAHTYDDIWIKEVISKNFKKSQKLNVYLWLNIWKGLYAINF